MYKNLGSREAAAAETPTGTNPGCWTAVFTPAKLNITVASYELYRACVETAAEGGAVKVRIGAWTCSVGPTGEGAEWDPSQPALVRVGETISFLFSQSLVVSPPPRVTIWLRYETQT